jgi:NAD(P)-dependent dehydrogenase (short-subunit alcohol dehydrogenase family)
MVNNLKVLITGSTQGIGLETARKFLANSAFVWITGRDEIRLREAVRVLTREFPDQQIQASAVDLTKAEDLSELAIKVERQWGLINCLVLNLGSGSPRRQGESKQAAKNRLFKINYQSPKDTLIIFEKLLEPDNSSVTFVSTIAVKIKSKAPKPYIKAKKKLEKYAQNKVLELSQKGIRCNVVRPGHTFAPGGVWERKLNENKEVTEKLITSTVPLGRLAQTSEIASAIYFLSSSEAKFITGATLDVAGGLGVNP